MASSLSAAPLSGRSFFDSLTPTHKVGSLSELLNSPPRRQHRHKIFPQNSDQELPPPPPTTLRATEKRKRHNLSATGSASSTPSPNTSPQKHSRTKSPETSINIDDEDEEIFTEELDKALQKKMNAGSNKRFVDLARGLLQRCILPLRCNANINVGSSTMPSPLLDYLTGILGDDPIDLVLVGDWTPPKFQDVYTYCRDLCRENRTDIPFGVHLGKSVSLYPIRRVECWDGDTDSFRGEGTLTINYGHDIQEHIRISVLGCIAGTGTGILVDESQRVWLYNPPNAVDQFLDGTSKGQAAVIMKSGDVMTKDTLWTPVEVYEGSTIEFDPELIDESSDDGGGDLITL